MKFFLSLLLGLFYVIAINAQFLEKKGELKKYEGYFDFYYSEDNDEIYLAVDKLDQEFLYVHSLSTGLGSNDIGLDRGQLGDGVLVKFIKSGNKLLLMQPNQEYRAITDNALEKRSVEQAFAKSVLFGFKIEETQEGTHIVNLTPFLMQDTHGVAARLKNQKEGNYALDKTRLTLWMENTKAFPKNVEFEAMLTFKGTPTGPNIRSIAPDSGSLTVIQHHSFVQLPDDKYSPRGFDPRSGAISMSYLDYATPIWEPIKKRMIVRHRLEKKNPELAVSEAVEPIVYYLDPGTPEPVRSALLEGGRWWNQAYESIGYKDAFQVKMLPEGADPMDLRYNMIQWVHRSTRGWSYGASIRDPRTGEILKGHVSLGSLRIRQDFMIAQALMNKPFAASDDNYGPMLEMALARIRQLSAHEIGHTLGFAHNFAASTNGKASVMDYPHPSLSFKGEQLDISNAYETGIGVWDKVTVAYSYGDIPAGIEEKTALSKILDDAFASGLQFISDSDARAQGGAHAYAHLWDNGANPVDELNAVLELRKKAIANFSIDNIRKGEPYSMLEDVFVPLYFYHRYQTEAAVKVIGGFDYNYKVKAGSEAKMTVIASNLQKAALDAVLLTVSPDILMIPQEKLELFPPRAFGYDRSRESFNSKMGVSFDPISAAVTASDMTLSLLLHPERVNRLINQNALDKSNMGIQDFLSRFHSALIAPSFNEKTYRDELGLSIKYTSIQHLMRLTLDNRALPQVKAYTLFLLKKIAKDYEKSKSIFEQKIYKDISAFLDDPEEFKPTSAPKIPDGSPIGSFQCLNIQE